MALGETADLAVRLSLDSGKFTSGLARANGSLGKFQSSVGRIGKGAGQLSTGLARAGSIIGVGVATGLVGAAKAAIDFEDAFAGVKKTVDPKDLEAAGLSFADLEKSFRDMAKRIPIAATDLAALGETAGALGVAAGDIDDFVETTALLGVTTNLSADEAADAFGRIGTILNLTGDDYEELADSIVALGNAGASTESEITEITKRFAGEAKAAGLMKEEIVGLASVTASLGFGPERGGTALARVFGNMGTNIALANKKGKAFAQAVGRPIEELQDEIDQGKGLPIFMDFLESLKGLSKTDADKLLFRAGIKNQADRTLFRTMADNLPEVNKQLKIATEATGALSKESAARFDTIASKLMVLKNNLIDVGITIGEGMLPALGRASEKLVKFLQTPENVDELKKLGTDIGDAIDGINWDEVLKGAKSLVGVMKSAFDWAKRLFDLFNSLPTELKGLLVGGLAVNKLSGGLVGAGLGNILGGAVKSALASIPIFGKAFVQPVFVTNMGPGGLGGPGGGAPLFGKGGLGKLLIGFTGVGLVAALASEFEDEIEGLANTLGEGWRGAVKDFFGVEVPTLKIPELEDLQWPFGPKNTPTILPELVGGNGILGGTPAGPTRGGGDRPSPGNPGLVRQGLANASPHGGLRGGAPVKVTVTNQPKPIKFPTPLPSHVREPVPVKPAVKPAVMPAGLRASEQKLDGIKTAVGTTIPSAVRTENLATRTTITTGNLATGFKLDAQKMEIANAKNAAATNSMLQRTAQSGTTTAVNMGAAATRGVAPPITSAVYAIGGQIAGAIWAARPVIQSTTIVQKYNVTQRGGGTSDSRTAAGTGNV